MTDRTRLAFDLELEVESPFLSQGVSQAAFGVDASQMANGQGRAIIPANQLKGVLRQAFRDLVTHAPASGASLTLEQALFGKDNRPATADADDDLRQDRGALLFSDLVGPLIRTPDGAPTGSDLLTRIAIAEDTGSVEHGALQVVELIAPLGETIRFTGTLSLTTQADRGKLVARLLRQALALVPAIGAFKSAGFGRVTRTSLRVHDLPAAVQMPPVPAAVAEVRRAEVVLHFDRPILVDAQREADNLFRSAEIIPGGVLKGALAQALRRQGEAPEGDAALSALVVGHAFPCQPGAERSFCEPLPDSLVLFGKGDTAKVHDWLLRDDAPYLAGQGAGAFAVDWKDRSVVTQALGWPEAPEAEAWELRVRTAIDRQRGTASDGQLFGSSARRSDGLEWRAVIDGVGLAAEDFARLLARLAGGLEEVGKTRARATVTVRAASAPPQAQPVTGTANLWAVTLRTPGLLNHPAALSDGASVIADYETYWAKVSGGSLTYVRHFARQDLAGGFSAINTRLEDGYYRPWLLTQPGAVFLLEGDGGTKLTEWLCQGLPPHPGLGANALDWRRCPYLPQNGYGAIAVNAVDHRALGPEAGHV